MEGRAVALEQVPVASGQVPRSHAQTDQQPEPKANAPGKEVSLQRAGREPRARIVRQVGEYGAERQAGDGADGSADECVPATRPAGGRSPDDGGR